MNLLPSILTVATVIGGIGNTQINLSAANCDVLQNGCKENVQVIVGTPVECISILEKLGVDINSIKDCFQFVIPEVGCSGNEADTPEAETSNPGQDTNTSGNDSVDVEESMNQSYVEQVVALVNAERAKVNLPALTMTEDLKKVAQIRAEETVQLFSHTRPDGSSFSTILNENGISYRGAGENIAWGQRTPEEVVNAWMNSAGHRANILNKNYTAIGVGYYLNGSTPYWVQLFTY